MILLIDNYDSFTYNLAHLIAQTTSEIVVKRNDAITVDEAMAMAPDAIVLSPGPSTPEKAGICVDLVKAAAGGAVPLFGVCLGLQSIAYAYGGDIVRANKLMHGKTSRIEHENSSVFKDVPENFTATRYHSLIAAPDTLPQELRVTARSQDDQEIMAIEHRDKPIAAVQFHPESIATDHGAQLFSNFLTWAGTR